MRLQKLLSAAGLCSRREAEKWIEAGRVAVNGHTASLGDGAEPGVDSVTVDGKAVSLPEQHTYVMLCKPQGYVTTLSDEKGRPTVADLLKEVPTRLYPVGRLDYDSEGLLIMTDDGELANRLMHPSHGVAKVYEVQVAGESLEKAAELLRHPLQDEDTVFQGAEVRILSRSVWNGMERGELTMTIREGKNREIRRMCALAGLRVLRLRRVEQGGVRLGELRPGQWRYLTAEEIDFLHHNG